MKDHEILKLHNCFKVNSMIVKQYGYWRYLDNFGQKNHTRKISNICKGFELYWIFMHNFLYQNVLIIPLYILLSSRIDTFWSEGSYIKVFWYSYYTYCLQEELTHCSLKVLIHFVWRYCNILVQKITNEKPATF